MKVGEEKLEETKEMKMFIQESGGSKKNEGGKVLTNGNIKNDIQNENNGHSLESNSK